MSIGEEIKNKRKAKGYTQDELAVLLNVTRQTVYNWEKGEILPTFENIASLNAVLDSNFTFKSDDKNEEVVVIREVSATSTATEQPKKDKFKLFLALSIVFAVSAILLGIITYCVGMIVFSNTDGYMKTSTSSLDGASFYFLLISSILFTITTIVFVFFTIKSKYKKWLK